MIASRVSGFGAALALVATGACTDGSPTEAPADDPLSAQMSRAAASPRGSGGNGSPKATVLRADLDELNGSSADGQVTVVVKNGSLMVSLQARGLSANLPHPQHIHIGGNNQCPGPGMAGEDGLISTVDGAPAYGPVRVSLTVTGDVGAGSALAVSRFPVANGAGVVTYRRSFELADGVTASDVAMGVVVVHGISELFADPTAYDGEPASSLDPSLPLEATVPALCGPLETPGS